MGFLLVISATSLTAREEREINVESGTRIIQGAAITGQAPLKVRVALGAECRIKAPLQVNELRKEGLGTLILEGDQRFAGQVMVQEGTLLVATPDALDQEKCRIEARPGSVVGFGYPITEKSLAMFRQDSAPAFTLALAADSDSDLDFGRNPGLARASLGAIGSPSFGGTLTPADGVYRLGGGTGTLTLKKSLAPSLSLIVGGYFAPSGERIFWPKPEKPREFAPTPNVTIVLPKGSTVPASTMIQNGLLKVGSRAFPPAPVNLTASRMGLRQVKLEWSGIEGAGEHVVELATDGGGFREVLRVGGDIREATLNELPEDASVSIRVRSVNDVLSSAPTQTLICNTRRVVPTAPDLIAATGAYTWVDLEWKGNSSEFGTVVEQSPDGETFAEARREPPGVTRTSIRVAETRTTFFRVACVDADGKAGDWSQVLSASTDATADVEKDLRQRFQLDSPARQFDPNRPASLPAYTDAEKLDQRQRGADLVKRFQTEKASNSTFEVPASVYRVPASAFPIVNLENFSVKAPGTTFIMEGETGGALFHLLTSKNITIEGPLKIKADPPMFSSARIIAADPKEKTIDIEVLPGFSANIEEPPSGKNKEFFICDEKGLFVRRSVYGSVESLGDRRVRLLVLRAPGEVGQFVAVRTSDTPYFRPFEFGTRPGQTSENVTVKDIDSYGVGGLDAKGMQGRFAFINNRTIPQPGTSQLFAGQPGQFFGRGSVMVWDGCESSIGNDDGINLRSASGLADASMGPETITIRRINPEVGERIIFHDFRTGEYLGEARVKTVEALNSPAIFTAGVEWMKGNRVGMTGKEAWTVTLDRPVRLGWYAQAYLPESGPRELIVRNSYWRDQNAQAILAQNFQQGLIADTLFERGTLQAIHITAGSYWQEGYWPNNVTIRNNVIRNNSPGPNRFSAPSIEVGFGMAEPGHVRGLIENCAIEDNTIINSGYSAILLNYGRNCRITGNTIINPGVIGGPDTPAVVIRGGENVLIKDNTVRFGHPSQSTWLEISEDTAEGAILSEGNKVYAADGSPLEQ